MGKILTFSIIGIILLVSIGVGSYIFFIFDANPGPIDYDCLLEVAEGKCTDIYFDNLSGFDKDGTGAFIVCDKVPFVIRLDIKDYPQCKE